MKTNFSCFPGTWNLEKNSAETWQVTGSYRIKAGRALISDQISNNESGFLYISARC
jgi:hypothetical protein